MFGGCFKEEAPELGTLSVEDTELERQPGKRDQTAKNVVLIYFRLILRHSLQTFKHSLIILAGTVDRSHNGFITLNQPRRIHLGHEVQRQIRIISRALPQQSSLAFQPAPELSVRKRGQQSDHGHRDSALAN